MKRYEELRVDARRLRRIGATSLADALMKRAAMLQQRGRAISAGHKARGARKS